MRKFFSTLNIFRKSLTAKNGLKISITTLFCNNERKKRFIFAKFQRKGTFLKNIKNATGICPFKAQVEHSLRVFFRTLQDAGSSWLEGKTVTKFGKLIKAEKLYQIPTALKAVLELGDWIIFILVFSGDLEPQKIPFIYLFLEVSNCSSSMSLVSTRILFSSLTSSMRHFRDSIWPILSL